MAQWSKVNSLVCEARWPILSSALPTMNPGVSFSMAKALIPFPFFAFGSVTAQVTMILKPLARDHGFAPVQDITILLRVPLFGYYRRPTLYGLCDGESTGWVFTVAKLWDVLPSYLLRPNS